MFSLPFVADYRAERKNGKLYLEVLTCGEGELPPLNAEITLRPVCEDDKALTLGKRKVAET